MRITGEPAGVAGSSNSSSGSRRLLARHQPAGAHLVLVIGVETNVGGEPLLVYLVEPDGEQMLERYRVQLGPLAVGADEFAQQEADFCALSPHHGDGRQFNVRASGAGRVPLPDDEHVQVRQWREAAAKLRFGSLSRRACSIARTSSGVRIRPGSGRRVVTCLMVRHGAGCGEMPGTSARHVVLGEGSLAMRIDWLRLVRQDDHRSIRCPTDGCFAAVCIPIEPVT